MLLIGTTTNSILTVNLNGSTKAPLDGVVLNSVALTQVGLRRAVTELIRNPRNNVLKICLNLFGNVSTIPQFSLGICHLR